MHRTQGFKKSGLLFLIVALYHPAIRADDNMLLWVGSVTDSSAKLVMDIPEQTDINLILETGHPDEKKISELSRADAINPSGQPLCFALTHLQPQTEYRYIIQTSSDEIPAKGRFQTFPDTPSSFSFVFGSCVGGKDGEGGGKTASEHPVFRCMAEEKPLFYLMTGDLHYSDIAVNDAAIFAHSYRTLFKSQPQRDLYRSTSFIYMWDDHDFGPDNSDGTSPSREASSAAYRRFIPHYPLAIEGDDAPIAQSFAVGRVKFILADQRSARSSRASEDTSTKSVLGEKQKAWLKEQLIDGRNNYALTVWVGSFPWIATANPQADDWGSFTHERRELANFIQTNNVDNLIMICGDAHMIAADDGSHNRYDDEQSKGFPVFHAAALHRIGSVKGGPYSEGAFGNPDNTYGQYAVMKINDDGKSFNFQYTGKRVNAQGESETLISWESAQRGP